MADRWLEDYIEIELQKADRKEVKYLLKDLMKPTQEHPMVSMNHGIRGDYGFVEDGGNVF